jgi:hypothetical protein
MDLPADLKCPHRHRQRADKISRVSVGTQVRWTGEFPGALPALVDAATFEAVQALMTHRQEAAGKARRRGSEYLLSGQPGRGWPCFSGSIAAS